MKTVFVRPGKQLTLKSSCHHIFGSGRGDVKLTISEGVPVGSEKNGGSNGFLGWTQRDVTLVEGQWAQVDEWYQPGAKGSTRYVASLQSWKEQRRKHLLGILSNRKIARDRQLQFQARAREIEANLRHAIQRNYKRWAKALVTTWYVEIVQNCNFGSGDLTSNKLRWEWETRKPQHQSQLKLPQGCEIAAAWLGVT